MLGWPDGEIDGALAEFGPFMEDGWLAVGLDRSGPFDALVLVHLWVRESGGDPIAEEAALARAWTIARDRAVERLGAPDHAEEARAVWRTATGALVVYRGLRDPEFGDEVGVYAVAARVHGSFPPEGPC